MKKLLLLILILPSMARGTTHTWTSDSASQFPKTFGIGYEGDTILISGGLESSCDMFTVNAPRMVIMGSGGDDTLFYGTGGGNSCEAIVTTSYGDSVVIRGLTILHDYDDDRTVEYDPDSDSDGTYITAEFCNAINLANSYKNDIIDCRIHVYGYDVRCIDNSSPGLRSVTIDSCRMWNNSWGYASRHSYGGSAVRLEIRAYESDWESGPADAFSAHIYRSAVLISPHAGFAVYSGGGTNPYQWCRGLEVEYCTTYVDHRNWAGGLSATSANAYGILTRFMIPPYRIAHNAIRAGTAHGGSRGIIVENTKGTATDSMVVDSNDIRVWSGPDEENPTGVCRVLRLRGIDGGEWDYVKIVGNHFEACIDTNASTTHIGSDASVFQFSLDTDGKGHGLFEHNTVVLRPLTQDCDGSAVEWAVWPTCTAPLDIISRYNRFISGDRVVWTADEGNAGSGHSLTFLQDTLSFLPPGDTGIDYTDQITWRIGYYVQDDTAGRAINCYYQNGTDDNDIVFDAQAGPHDFTLIQRINISAIGTNDQLIADAGFIAVNSKGDTVLKATSVAAGDTVFDFRYFYSWGNNNGTDTNLNPFDIRVWKGTDTTKLNDTTIDWHVTCLPVHLASTAGTLSASDSCAVEPDVCVTIVQNLPTNNDTVSAQHVGIDIDLFDTDGDTLTVVLIGELGDATPEDTLVDTILIADDDWVWTWNALTEDADYYWKAIAVDTAGCADTSAIWHFVVDSVPAAAPPPAITIEGITIEGTGVNR